MRNKCLVVEFLRFFNHFTPNKALKSLRRNRGIECDKYEKRKPLKRKEDND